MPPFCSADCVTFCMQLSNGAYSPWAPPSTASTYIFKVRFYQFCNGGVHRIGLAHSYIVYGAAVAQAPYACLYVCR
jgi:hypothetical protein